MDSDTILQALKAFNFVIDLLNEIEGLKHKTKGWKLLGSKKSEITEKRIKEALESTKNTIESFIWYGKGFAIRAECGIEVDVEFHQLIGLLIQIFNDVSVRLAPEKFDDAFIGYFKSQLETLVENAQQFWRIEEIRKDDPEKAKKASEKIQNYRPLLFKFGRNMESYLKEPKKPDTMIEL